MRLKETRIDLISKIIFEQLVKENYIESENPNSTASVIKKVIIDDLMVEEHLDREVREILEEHQNSLDRRHVEFHSMFRLIKNKLIRERNLII